MNLRGRLERLEARRPAGGPACPGCGWNGAVRMVTEIYGPDGRTVRLLDADGNELPAWPEPPSCDLCRDEVRFLVFRMPDNGRRDS